MTATLLKILQEIALTLSGGGAGKAFKALLIMPSYFAKDSGIGSASIPYPATSIHDSLFEQPPAAQTENTLPRARPSHLS